MSHNGLNSDSIAMIRYGRGYLPYETWGGKFEKNYFYDFVESGLKPFLIQYNYHIPMNTVELGDRIAFWGWEVYAYEKSGKTRPITSLQNERHNKTREQFVNYEMNISADEWNRLFDNWETEYLFMTTMAEGLGHRYKFPEFIWKLVDDDNWSDHYESEDEAPPVKRETTMNELGWVTNNRRNF